MKAFWHCKDLNNFGDRLTPYIIYKVTGKWPEHSKEGKHYFLAGSILQEANDDTIVIGSGFGAKDQTIKTKKAKVLAVRGPLSGAILARAGYTSNWLYGDPGLTLPYFYPKHGSPDLDLGVFPHYVDYPDFVDSGYFIINPTAPVETVLANMFRCKRIITSSLHGFIAAQVYGIPALLVTFGGNIAGDGMKYTDYMLATNQTPYKPIKQKKEGLRNLATPLVLVRPSGDLYKLIRSLW